MQNLIILKTNNKRINSGYSNNKLYTFIKSMDFLRSHKACFPLEITNK